LLSSSRLVIDQSACRQPGGGFRFFPPLSSIGDGLGWAEPVALFLSVCLSVCLAVLKQCSFRDITGRRGGNDVFFLSLTPSPTYPPAQYSVSIRCSACCVWKGKKIRTRAYIDLLSACPDQYAASSLTIQRIRECIWGKRCCKEIMLKFHFHRSSLKERLASSVIVVSNI
jgi:hypothetical protein